MIEKKAPTKVKGNTKSTSPCSTSSAAASNLKAKEKAQEHAAMYARQKCDMLISNIQGSLRNEGYTDTAPSVPAEVRAILINGIRGDSKDDGLGSEGHGSGEDVYEDDIQIKNEDEELLLNSEHSKQLSSKERRQLRNRISARHFRLRRKEYISQLESLVRDMSIEISSLEKTVAELRGSGSTERSAAKSNIKRENSSDGSDLQHYDFSRGALASSSIGSDDQQQHDLISPLTSIFLEQPMQQQASNSSAQVHSWSAYHNNSDCNAQTQTKSQPQFPNGHTGHDDFNFLEFQPELPGEYLSGAKQGHQRQQHQQQGQQQQQQYKQHQIPDHQLKNSQLQTNHQSSRGFSSLLQQQQQQQQQQSQQMSNHPATFDNSSSAFMALKLNPSVASLLPAYSVTGESQMSSMIGGMDWALDGIPDTTHQNIMSNMDEHHNGLIRVPNAQIFPSLLPDLEKQLDILEHSSPTTGPASNESGTQEHDSDQQGDSQEQKQDEKRLKLALAAAEDVFRKLDAQLAGMNLS